MPTVRYQIRNEYGLADPELYQTADKDDPEAILEGAAMAGLVGVLRQLGDLAEFAAEIFRDLHEQVLGTAAKGHGFLLRVQQLEAEFPSIEKSLFSQSTLSNFADNEGIDWHYSFQMDQSLINQEDMPRFILDSYEECRRPPPLFILDKFDTAGAGACLKRYSDPSFFKMELVSGLRQTYIPKEKKSRKTRKKGSRWKNCQTLESLLLTHANSNLQPTSPDQVLDKAASRIVRMKSGNLSGSIESEAVKLWKCLFEVNSDRDEVGFGNSSIHSTINAISGESIELASETHEPFVGILANHPLTGDASSIAQAKAVKMLTTLEVNHGKKEDEADALAQHQPFSEVEKPQISFMDKENLADSENKLDASVYDYNLSDSQKTTALLVVDHGKKEDEADALAQHQPFSEVEKPQISFMDKENLADSENKLDASVYDYNLSDSQKTTALLVVDRTLIWAEHKTEGSSYGYRTDAISSELENFVDAQNSIESEVETDSEIKGRLDLGILTKEAHEMERYSTVRLHNLETETSNLNTECSSGTVGILSFSCSDASDIPAEKPITQEKIIASNSSANMESFHDLLPHDKVANSSYLTSDEASNVKKFDNLRSYIPDELCCSHVADSTSSLNQFDPQGSYDAVKLLSADQYEISAGNNVQVVPDEIAELSKGLTHSDSTSPSESHHAKNVDELISKEMMETFEMPNGLSCPPTRNASFEYPDRKHTLILTLPTTNEMQYSGDEDAKAYNLEDDIEASTCEGSNLTSAFLGTVINIVRHDALTATLDNGHEGLPLVASFDCVKGSNITLTMISSTLENEDDKISESHDCLCCPVKLMPEDKSLRTDLTDHVSDTECDSRIINVTEVLEYHSNITIEKSLQLINQEAVVNSTETILPPVPAIATVSDEGGMKGMENIGLVKNIAYLRMKGGCENTHMAKDNHAMPEVTKSQLEGFSDTEEFQESQASDGVNYVEEYKKFHNLNSAEESQKPDRVNYVEEYKKSHKWNSAEESQESSRLNRTEEFQKFPKAAEKETLPCCENGTYSHKVMHSPMQVHVLNNLKLPTDINQDSYQKDMQGVKQIIHAMDLPAEDFASGDETHNSDPSLLDSLDLLPRLPADSTADAAMACEHLLMNHDIYSPRREGTESGCKLNKSFSSRVENSELDSAALSSASPTTKSSSANDAVLVEHFQAYQHTNADQTSMDYPVEVEDLCLKSSAQGRHKSAKQDLYLSTKLISDHVRLPEGASISHVSDEVDLKPEFPEYVYDKKSGEYETYNHAFVNNLDHNDVKVLPLNTDVTEVLYSEGLVLSECSSEASVHNLSLNVPEKTFSFSSSCDIGKCSLEVSADHLAVDVTDKTLPLLSSSYTGFTNSVSRLSYEPQLEEATYYSSSQNLEEPPSLPPLPPFEWRSQKHQVITLLPSDNSCETLSGGNLLTELPDNQTVKAILPSTFTLSELPPIIVDQRYQHDGLTLEKNIVHSTNASSLSSLEFEKSLCVLGAERGSKLPVVDSFASVRLVESQISQYSTTLEVGVHPAPDKRFQFDQPFRGVEVMKSHHFELSHPSLERVMPQPQNPFLGKSTLEDVSDQFTCGDLKGENMHLLKSSTFTVSSGSGMPQSGYVYSLAGNQSTLFGALPTTVDEWFGIKPYSIRSRPRTPLIEAVAAHDRSTLRKVSELARPSEESKEDKKESLLESYTLQLRKVSQVVKPYPNPKADERDALLEQIRNKSFTLKPIVLSKPSNENHCTDIKVAAILEKANALRQAVAGSDEEDAGDYWSD